MAAMVVDDHISNINLLIVFCFYFSLLFFFEMYSILASTTII